MNIEDQAANAVKFQVAQLGKISDELEGLLERVKSISAATIGLRATPARQGDDAEVPLSASEIQRKLYAAFPAIEEMAKSDSDGRYKHQPYERAIIDLCRVVAAQAKRIDDLEMIVIKPTSGHIDEHRT